MYLHRTLCDVLEAMRKCYETRNFSYLLGLIEEAQDMGNRMESSLYAGKDLKHLVKECKKLEEKQKELREDIKRLEEKKKNLSKSEKKALKKKYKESQQPVPHGPCADGGLCEYDGAWGSVTPQPCKKCGRVMDWTVICSNNSNPGSTE